jgi:hypothetical protein
MSVVKAKIGRTYQIELAGGDVNYLIHAKLISKSTRFRGIIYWALYGPVSIHLVDPDDIIRMDEVKLWT